MNEEGQRDEFLLPPKIFSTKDKTMGDHRKRTKLSKYDLLRKNAELWGLFERAWFTPYFVAMEG